MLWSISLGIVLVKYLNLKESYSLLRTYHCIGLELSNPYTDKTVRKLRTILGLQSRCSSPVCIQCQSGVTPSEIWYLKMDFEVWVLSSQSVKSWLVPYCLGDPVRCKAFRALHILYHGVIHDICAHGPRLLWWISTVRLNPNHSLHAKKPIRSMSGSWIVVLPHYGQYAITVTG